MSKTFSSAFFFSPSLVASFMLYSSAFCQTVQSHSQDELVVSELSSTPVRQVYLQERIHVMPPWQPCRPQCDQNLPLRDRRLAIDSRIACLFSVRFLQVKSLTHMFSFSGYPRVTPTAIRNDTSFLALAPHHLATSDRRSHERSSDLVG